MISYNIVKFHVNLSESLKIKIGKGACGLVYFAKIYGKINYTNSVR